MCENDQNSKARIVLRLCKSMTMENQKLKKRVERDELWMRKEKHVHFGRLTFARFFGALSHFKVNSFWIANKKSYWRINCVGSNTWLLKNYVKKFIWFVIEMFSFDRFKMHFVCVSKRVKNKWASIFRFTMPNWKQSSK